MDKHKTLYVSNRQEWRAWLKKNYQSAKGIMLVYYKKHTGKPRLSYNEAVEEALCFGWIDSTVRSVDKDSFAQRFSLRNPKSSYSQANRERLRALAKQGKVIKAVLASLGNLDEEEFALPPDILAAIKASAEAWHNLQGFSPSYIRIRIAYIDAARNRPEEFNKRLKNFIKNSEKNKKFGFGGIEKYY